jgi:hypothetical protein
VTFTFYDIIKLVLVTVIMWLLHLTWLQAVEAKQHCVTTKQGGFEKLLWPRANMIIQFFDSSHGFSPEINLREVPFANRFIRNNLPEVSFTNRFVRNNLPEVPFANRFVGNNLREVSFANRFVRNNLREVPFVNKFIGNNLREVLVLRRE